MDTTSVNYITFMLMDATSVNYISCDVTCNKCELHNYPPSAHQCTALHPLSVLGIRHRGLQLVLGIRHRGLQLVLGSQKKNLLVLGIRHCSGQLHCRGKEHTIRCRGGWGSTVDWDSRGHGHTL